MTLRIYLDWLLQDTKTIDLQNEGDSGTISAVCGSIVITYAERINYRDYEGQPSWEVRFTEIDTPAEGYVLVQQVLSYSGSGAQKPEGHDYPLYVEFPDYHEDNNVREYHNTRAFGTWDATIDAYFISGGSASSSDDSFDDSSDDSSEESEDGPLLYNPATGNLRYNPLTNHLRYRHIQSS